jgi:molybdenum cofactor cytidylyltransferase
LTKKPGKPGDAPAGDKGATVNAQPQLAGILLAAGGASRFGGPKQVALFEGVPLVARAARAALAACPAGVVVVTGAYDEQVRQRLAGLPVRIVHNAGWGTGLASSICVGLAGLPAGPSACLVMLCDQPAVDEDDLHRLIDAWMAVPERVAAAQYAGTLGAPAIFPEAFWPGLRALGGDRGARAFIASLPQVTAVAMPHAARDIDTPADLEGGK